MRRRTAVGGDLDQANNAELLRRLLGATPWIVGCMALFAFYLRISFTGHVSSDGANSALQAWDILHGHLLLHGWIIGDATYGGVHRRGEHR